MQAKRALVVQRTLQVDIVLVRAPFLNEIDFPMAFNSIA